MTHVTYGHLGLRQTAGGRLSVEQLTTKPSPSGDFVAIFSYCNTVSWGRGEGKTEYIFTCIFFKTQYNNRASSKEEDVVCARTLVEIKTGEIKCWPNR
jgi:hypothetical protein